MKKKRSAKAKEREQGWKNVTYVGEWSDEEQHSTYKLQG
jgi:hypothetical protein